MSFNEQCESHSSRPQDWIAVYKEPSGILRTSTSTADFVDGDIIALVRYASETVAKKEIVRTQKRLGIPGGHLIVAPYDEIDRGFML